MGRPYFRFSFAGIPAATGLLGRGMSRDFKVVCGSCWEAELREGHAAWADLCSPAGTCGRSGKENLVCFYQSVVTILALMKACSEDLMKLFSVVTMRFMCIS